MLRLFSSYAREDVTQARRLAADLHRPGIEPWMDDVRKLAGQWNEEIPARIGASDLFLPLLSQATQEGGADRFFRKEWQIACTAKRPFLPLRLVARFTDFERN